LGSMRLQLVVDGLYSGISKPIQIAPTNSNQYRKLLSTTPQQTTCPPQ
jgi:hypothetical protein